MKRKCRIEKRRAVQIAMPMLGVATFLQEGVGHLLRQASLALMQAVMDQEVRHLAGERHAQGDGGSADRWGSENGYCVIDGQKVPIQRQRLRGSDCEVKRAGRKCHSDVTSCSNAKGHSRTRPGRR